jgi:hypothetical protein
MGYYSASSGNSLPKFRVNPSVQFSKVKNRVLTLENGEKNPFFTVENVPIGCHETSVRNRHYPLRKSPKERGSLSNQNAVQ